jgi:4-hydroxybenzoate polyprenyltransferase
MLRISPLRALISGGVKTTGSIAAVFAVDPSPSVSYVALLFLWLFFWEIGGQNIPNDWADIDEDRRLGARTILVRYGPKIASFISLVTLILTLITKIALIYSSKMDNQHLFVFVSVIAGCALFIPPALRLYRTRKSAHAMSLFKRASYYPPSMLILIIIAILI